MSCYASVDPDLVAACPSEKLIDRHVEALAQCVPHGLFDTTYGACQNWSSTIESRAIHSLPVMLNWEGSMPIRYQSLICVRPQEEKTRSYVHPSLGSQSSARFSLLLSALLLLLDVQSAYIREALHSNIRDFCSDGPNAAVIAWQSTDSAAHLPNTTTRDFSPLQCIPCRFCCF